MITAHIKSTFGNRDEVWEDNRVKPDQQGMLEEFDAYVVGSPTTDNLEVLTVVYKYYWDIFEEIVQFDRDEPGDYPAITQLTKKSLQTISSYFQEYLGIEKQFLAQATVPAERYAELKQAKDRIEIQNDIMYEQLLAVSLAMKRTEQTQPNQLVISAMVFSLYDFTIYFGESLKALEVMLAGLRERSEGGDYTPLDFVRDLGAFKKSAEARRDQEQSLTKSRNEFNAFVQRTSIKT